MNKVREIYIGIRDNVSNAFAVVGIALTVYFAVFYVPNYVEEIEERRIQNAHESLMESIQELVYNDHKIDSDDLDTLIRGKELSKRIEYPYSSDELLIQVQNQFLENKFIPLDQRKALIEKIDDVREGLPEPVEKPKERSLTSFFTLETLLSLTSVLVGIAAAALGAISIWVRNNALEEIKIESMLEDREETIRQSVHEASVVERQMYDRLKEYLGPDHVEYCPPSTPVDFLVKTKSGRDVGVEVKYLRNRLIPVRILDHIASSALELKMPIVLLANASLTKSARKRQDDFNEQHPDTSIQWINFDESVDLEREIRKFFA